MNLQTVLEWLYEAEINCSIASFWDNGYRVKLGDESNGFVAEETFHTDPKLGRPVSEIGDWLERTAKEHYPNMLVASIQ